MESITLLDQASTYPPCVEFLESQGERVVHLPNLGHKALFVANLQPDGPFILSDPDVVPLGPPEGVEYLWELSQRLPFYKVGFGISLEGVTMPIEVREHERQFWNPGAELEPGVFMAPIDTTFAIWQPDRSPLGYFSGIRTGPPHVVRHTSYHSDYTHPENFSEEDKYYLEHAEGPWSGWKHDLKRYGP